ncbi:hypothetical protein BGW38_004134, partial [Lunasporangiospora selenospora]
MVYEIKRRSVGPTAKSTLSGGVPAAAPLEKHRQDLKLHQLDDDYPSKQGPDPSFYDDLTELKRQNHA